MPSKRLTRFRLDIRDEISLLECELVVSDSLVVIGSLYRLDQFVRGHVNGANITIDSEITSKSLIVGLWKQARTTFSGAFLTGIVTSVLYMMSIIRYQDWKCVTTQSKSVGPSVTHCSNTGKTGRKPQNSSKFRKLRNY